MRMGTVEYSLRPSMTQQLVPCPHEGTSIQGASTNTHILVTHDSFRKSVVGVGRLRGCLSPLVLVADYLWHGDWPQWHSCQQYSLLYTGTLHHPPVGCPLSVTYHLPKRKTCHSSDVRTAAVRSANRKWMRECGGMSSVDLGCGPMLTCSLPQYMTGGGRPPTTHLKTTRLPLPTVLDVGFCRNTGGVLTVRWACSDVSPPSLVAIQA